MRDWRKVEREVGERRKEERERGKIIRKVNYQKIISREELEMSRPINFLEQLLKIATKPQDVEFLVQLLFDLKKGR